MAVKRDMTIVTKWRTYELVIPKDAPLVQKQETKRAFYAGVAAILDILLQLADPAISEREGMMVLESCRKEVVGFTREVERGAA